MNNNNITSNSNGVFNIDIPIVEYQIKEDTGLDSHFKEINKIFEMRNKDIRDIISYVKSQINQGATEIYLDNKIIWKK